MKNIFTLVLISVCILISCSNKSSGGGGGGGGNNSFIPNKGGGNKNGENNENFGNDAQVSCVLHQGKICAEFVGAAWNANSIAQVCGQYQGNLMQNKCSGQGIVGQCILNKGSGEEALVKYYAPVTRDLAEKDCNEAGGIMR